MSCFLKNVCYLRLIKQALKEWRASNVEPGISQAKKQNMCRAKLSWKSPPVDTLHSENKSSSCCRSYKASEEKKSIHTLWMQLKCVSPQMTVIGKNKTEKGRVLIHFRRCQSPLSLHCLSLTPWWTHDNQGEPWLVWFFKAVTNMFFIYPCLHSKLKYVIVQMHHSVK